MNLQFSSETTIFWLRASASATVFSVKNREREYRIGNGYTHGPWEWIGHRAVDEEFVSSDNDRTQAQVDPERIRKEFRRVLRFI